MEEPSNKTRKELKVAELFAGVGGFRIGLCGTQNKPQNGYKIEWSNQWEPATKRQHASEVYVARFGSENHSNEDIAKVLTKDIPDHDLLCGGFPCQDYSVARTLSHAKGLEGKKGVLWWEIHRILKEKGNKAPSYLFLENVDRLIKSPAKQRGRDFAIMLSTLANLGYAVEWRIINAADYGMPQRRRRVYLLGYKNNSKIFLDIKKDKPVDWILKNGVIAKVFPSLFKKESQTIDSFDLNPNPLEITKSFNSNDLDLRPFENAGVMINHKVSTLAVRADYSGPIKILGDVLLPENKVPPEFFIPKNEVLEWKKLKGAKKEERTTKSGFTYNYSEGPIAFPDSLDKPSRTIVTGEGGSGPSRFKHVVKTKSGKLRRLTPLELERLSTFPDNHTRLADISDNKRAFFIGNALVVGVVERIGESLLATHKSTSL